LKYRFFDEGTDETLKIVNSKTKITNETIDRVINELEDETGCYVLWEEVTNAIEKHNEIQNKVMSLTDEMYELIDEIVEELSNINDYNEFFDKYSSMETSVAKYKIFEKLNSMGKFKD